MDGHDRGVLLLAAEAAAGLGLDDDRLAVGERERALERGVDVVRALERAVHGDAAVVPRDGDHPLVLDVQLLLVADPVRALDDQVGGGERRPRHHRCRPRSGRTRGPTRAGRRPAAAARSAGARHARAARSVSRSGAARRATGSAWWRISSVTSTGWSDWMAAMTFSPGMSAAVTTTTRLTSRSRGRARDPGTGHAPRSSGSWRRTRRRARPGRRRRAPRR